MEERYNPMKSAEIDTEHNYNMLDGVLNNQAVSYTHLGPESGPISHKTFKPPLPDGAL